MSKQTLDYSAITTKLSDPIYFIESCLYIVDKDSVKVPFLLNSIQKRYMANRSRLDIILKARKLGFSTLVMALWLHACLTRHNTRAVIVSHEDESTKRLFKRVRYMVDHCAVKVQTAKASETELVFPATESTFWIGTAGARAFGRGDDITHAHMSEPAFYPNQAVVTGVQQALVRDSWFLMESTANGAGTAFHNACLKAVAGESNFKLHFVPWFDDPEYAIASSEFDLTPDEKKLKAAFGVSYSQLAWRRKKLRDMDDPALFPQEFPSTMEEAFLATGRMVFDWQAIRAQEAVAEKVKWRGEIVDAGTEVLVTPEPKGRFVVYKTPVAGRRYLVTTDAGEGIPQMDYSVADVYDAKSGEQVAQWRGWEAPAAFAEIVRRIGRWYNWALLAPENNYPGNAVVQALGDYPTLYYDMESKDVAQPRSPGFRTTHRSKALMLAAAREALKDLDIKLNSGYTFNELRTYVVGQDGKLGATEGCNDDTVTTYMAAAWILRKLTLDDGQSPITAKAVFGTWRKKAYGSAGANRVGGIV